MIDSAPSRLLTFGRGKLSKSKCKACNLLPLKPDPFQANYQYRGKPLANAVACHRTEKGLDNPLSPATGDVRPDSMPNERLLLSGQPLNVAQGWKAIMLDEVSEVECGFEGSRSMESIQS